MAEPSQIQQPTPQPVATAQPGTVIAPSGAPAPQPTLAPETPVQPAPVSETPPAPPEPAPPIAAPPEPVEQTPADPAPAPGTTNEELSPFQMQDQDLPADYGGIDAITWTASEFVAHDKSSGWYLMLLAGAVAISALVFLITRDYISVVVVIGAALLLAMYGSHKPRQLEYQIDSRGVAIGQKLYSFQDFKSFSVIPEGAFSSIVFMPLKRFAPPLSIYYAPEDEENILEVLNRQLPFEDGRRDVIDAIMRRIRF